MVRLQYSWSFGKYVVHTSLHYFWPGMVVPVRVPENCLNIWLMLNWIVCVTLQYLKQLNCASEWVMLNRIFSIRSQYLKSFNCGQKLNYWYYIAVLKTIQLCSNEWIVIIIILSCHRLGYPWPFLATSPYPSSLPAGPPVSSQSCCVWVGAGWIELIM